MKVFIVTGTARKGNYTDRVAEEVEEAFEGLETRSFYLSDREVPVMEERADGSGPSDVEEYRENVDWCDVLIPVLPEYNHGIPGGFKNLFDYVYEEYEDTVFCPVTVSAGGFGGIRAMSHLNDIMLAVGGNPGPSLHVSNVRENFDPVTEEYREKIEEFKDQVSES